MHLNYLHDLDMCCILFLNDDLLCLLYIECFVLVFSLHYIFVLAPEPEPVPKQPVKKTPSKSSMGTAIFFSSSVNGTILKDFKFKISPGIYYIEMSSQC